MATTQKIISDSFTEILKNKGKVSISDIVSDTGYSKPTIYKHLSKSQFSKLISQPSPFKDKISKEVNQIINDVFNNKKPLINASPNKIFEKIYGKKFNIKTDNIGVIKKILEENPNWPKIKEAVTNTSTRVGAGNKIFETVKFKDFDKAYAKAMKSRSLTRAGTVEEFILRDLKRHIDQGGTKFKFAKGNSLEKGFKGLKITDLTKGDTIDFAAIKKDDPRFKEYKKVFNDIKKLKLTPYTNPITQEKITLLKGLQEATGVDAPLHIQHGKGVATEPLKNLSIATHKANIGAKMVGSVEDVETLGVRSTIPGGKRVYGPVLNFEDEVNRLTKWADRKILQTEASGFVKPKTPTETLDLFNIFKKGTPKEQFTIATTLKCVPGNADGGRIGYALGTGTVNCVQTKLATETEIPKLTQLDDSSPGLTKMKNAATGFLGFAKKGGKFGAITAGGAAAAGLVKTFMNDDPTTYLSDENQQKNMLIDMVTSPMVDQPDSTPEILDWQLPALGATTVAGTAATAPSTIKATTSRALGAKQSGITKTALKTLGRGLAASGTPLGLAALEPLHIAGQVQAGDSLGEIATNPWNYAGLAFADDLSKFATKGVGPGIAKAMRLGISPAALRVGSRFLGMPGLALSLGISGYEMYDDYKKKRGWFSEE
jgi:hypothetical protein